MFFQKFSDGHIYESLKKIFHYLGEMKEQNQNNFDTIQKKIGRVNQDESLKSVILEVKNELGNSKCELQKIIRLQKENNQENVTKLASDIIGLRDQILIFLSEADEREKRIVSSFYKELGRILERNGIKSLENTGEFNEAYQTIVGIRSTKVKALDNTVAEIFRPGYKLKDGYIRSQEIILYQYKEEGV
ncbi:nucleotide exchange factor GrpE [Crassaminicella profunda]|uniref:nucleotide exchange factor GrpE n=1 Tax=Crassaminicella profunda TaxID=1286698 RepID=UPI001CA71C91|nr:nucleotide exchange factor GrpE [Crassaminicella profunda]QZY56859.1 nucleotide exchange factor GrpE [Crassaminicella profunda]